MTGAPRQEQSGAPGGTNINEDLEEGEEMEEGDDDEEVDFVSNNTASRYVSWHLPSSCKVLVNNLPYSGYVRKDHRPQSPISESSTLANVAVDSVSQQRQIWDPGQPPPILRSDKGGASWHKVWSKRYKRQARAQGVPLGGRIPEPTGGQPPDDDTSVAVNARWNSWDKLYGGGPIEDVTMERAAEQHGGTLTNEDTTIDGGIRVRAIQQTPAQHRVRAASIDDNSTHAKLSGVPLSSMASLRGPHARLNRATHFQGIEKAPNCSGLTQVRYPHKAKQWHLGVGKCAGKEKAEGLFAIGASAETVVFYEGGFICPVKGHQQTTKPRHLNNHAWFHNGIPEGQEGCVYINAYHNEDSPIRWLQMAAVEPLANCQIRRVPRHQGGGDRACTLRRTSGMNRNY